MNEKILIVDDNLESLKLIGLMLQRRGYAIVAVQSGEQALQLAETEHPDLVILDIMMPGIDGYQVCRRLRENPTTASIPILMFTAKSLTSDKVAGLQAGADDYLIKPIQPTELAARVEALLQRAEAGRARTTTLTRARVVGLLGARGGVGVTTLAVNLAAALSQSLERDKRIILADLHAGQGSVALLLGQTWDEGLSDLLDYAPDDLSQQVIEKQIVAYQDNLSVLPTSYRPTDNDRLFTPEYADLLVNHLANGSDYLILDLGAGPSQTTQNAMAHCNQLIVVVEPERACLTLARALIESINQLDLMAGQPSVVVVDRGGFGDRYNQTMIASLLGCPVYSPIVPGASEAAFQALEQGAPIVSLYPDSPIANAYQQTSRQIFL